MKKLSHANKNENDFNLSEILNLDSHSNVNKKNSGLGIINNTNYTTAKNKINGEVTFNYFGNVEGKIGIATKKIVNFISLTVPQICLTISGFNTLNIDGKKVTKKYLKLKNTEPQINFIKKKVGKVYVKDFINYNINYEMDNIIILNNKCKKNLNNLHTLEDISNNFKETYSNLRNKKSTIFSKSLNYKDLNVPRFNSKLPHLYKQMMNKQTRTNKSELISSNRYGKLKINTNEFISNHNALGRKEMISRKVNDYNLKCAIGVEGLSERIKSGIRLKESKGEKYFEIKNAILKS